MFVDITDITDMPLRESDLEQEYRRGYKQGVSKVIDLIHYLHSKGFTRPVEIASIIESWLYSDVMKWEDNPNAVLPPDFKHQSWGEIRSKIKGMDNHCCVECSSTKNLEIHHVRKVSDGGLPSEDNLVTLCKKCHSAAFEHKKMNVQF